MDLLDQEKTLKYLKSIKPDFVIIAAAKVGGIYSNSMYPAQFIYENLMIQAISWWLLHQLHYGSEGSLRKKMLRKKLLTKTLRKPFSRKTDTLTQKKTFT